MADTTAIASDIQRIHGEYYGQTPGQVRVFEDGDILVVLIEETFTRAEQILNAALANATAPPEWQASARSLLVPAWAAQGRIREAEELLQQIPVGSVERSLSMIDALAELTERAAANLRQPLAALQLVAIGDLLARRD